MSTIVLYPAPGIGHVVSMVELGKLILLRNSAAANTTITILLTTGHHDSPSLSAYIDRISTSNPSITFLRFPHIQPSSAPNLSGVAILFDFVARNYTHLEQAMTSITKSKKVNVFIIDFFCQTALTLGHKLNLQTYYFFTSGAAVLGMYLYFPTIDQTVGFDTSFRELKTTFLSFPELPKIRAEHVPEPLLDLYDPAYQYTINCCQQMAKASGIIVNTFRGFEPEAEKGLEKGAYLPDSITPPIYYIGPLIADPKEQKEGRSKEMDQLISWLDQQPEQSVVFVCFGSRGVFEVGQLKQIAIGLERSGIRFFWVVKSPDKTVGPDEFELTDALFSDGFLQRTKNRGLVVKSWAPQVEVLSHASIGGFVTHCGWNSVLESVVCGVPMLAWPIYAEQFVNRTVLVESMEMAIGIEEDQNGFVTADEFEMKVKELMDSEKGSLLRERSLKMKEMSSAAMADSGSSTDWLSKLLEVWN